MNMLQVPEFSAFFDYVFSIVLVAVFLNTKQFHIEKGTGNKSGLIGISYICAYKHNT